VSAENLAKARALAEEALCDEPLAPGVLTILGRIAEMQGDQKRAEALMELVGQRALRDYYAQAWLANNALKKGDFAGVLPHLDAILRTQPDMADRPLQLLAAFISVPRALFPLEELLKTDPPWRPWFLQEVAAKSSDRAALERLYADLAAGAHPPTDKELGFYLDRLIKDGSYDKAYQVWHATLSAPQAADQALLYDGNFQYPLSGAAFDWQIQEALGADVDVAGGSLRIEFSGARVDFKNVSHLLVLPAGSYRLSGEVEAEELHTERGLWWRVFCLGHPDASLGETELVASSTPWRPFDLTFQIPAESCPAQVLQLELPARVALEKRIEGVVSYRNMAVSPVRQADDETSGSPNLR
jgi:hypothetical protein